MPNIVKIDPYIFELYCFKVGPFFRHLVAVVESFNAVHACIADDYSTVQCGPDKTL